MEKENHLKSESKMTTIRIPNDLFSKIMEDAKKQDRNISNYIVTVLKKHLTHK
jgi:predicted DNA binding CopG/RHH family protein